MAAKLRKSYSFFTQILWDAWCILSIVGIWPRFIEPNLIVVNHLDFSITGLPSSLNQLKILQFSDLHISPKLSDRFLTKAIRKIQALDPDLIVFTGDFICYSNVGANVGDRKRLLNFLKNIPQARYGNFAILGNHDYAQSVSINEQGDYDIAKRPSSAIVKGFRMLCSETQLTCRVTPAAQSIKMHRDLMQLIGETPFKLLHNETLCIPIKDNFINLTGLGEYIIGRCQPERAFAQLKNGFPSIVLAHNPDSISLLKDYPGDLILSGHTHGGQINLPWMWRKFTVMENKFFKSGLYHLKNKWIYINRGLGSVMKFRWFAPPELTLITLQSQDAP